MRRIGNANLRRLAVCGVAACGLAVCSPIASGGEPAGSGTYFSIGLGNVLPEGVRFTDGEDAGHAALYGGPYSDAGEFDVNLQWHVAVGRPLFANLRGQVEFNLAGGLDYRGDTNYRFAGDAQPSRAELSTQQVLLAGFHDFAAWTPAPDVEFRPYLGAGIGVTHYRLKHYVQSFPEPDNPNGYRRRGPGGEVSVTRLPKGSGYASTLMLAAGVVIPVTERMHLDLGYRYADAGEIGTDADAIDIVRYDAEGNRIVDTIRVNPTVTDLGTHAVTATLRFEF